MVVVQRDHKKRMNETAAECRFSGDGKDLEFSVVLLVVQVTARKRAFPIGRCDARSISKTVALKATVKEGRY